MRSLPNFDASGQRWFVDDTPWTDEEIELAFDNLQGRATSPAAADMDLITAIELELECILWV